MKKYEITSGIDFFYFSDQVNILVDLELGENVNADVLQKAAELVLKRFPFFAVKKTVSEDNSRYILESNPAPFKITERNGYAPIDDDSAGNYMLSISYWENHIFLNVFHGMTDGSGAKTFACTIVRAYFECLDNRIYAGSARTDVRATPTDEEYADPFDYCREVDVPFKVKRHKPFFFSKDDVYETGSRLFRFSVPENTIVSFSKQFESGVSGLIALAMARSIDIIRRQDDKPVCISCPIDMRRILGCTKTMRNCTKSARYEHSAKLRSLSTEQQMTAIKGQMLVQSSEEYQLPRFNEDLLGIKAAYAYEDIDIILGLYSRWEKTLTPIVSYLGIIDFGELNGRVTDVNIYSRIIGTAGMQAVCLCYNGRCNINTSCNLRDDRYIKMFANEMQDFSGSRTPVELIDYNAPAAHREDISIG